MRVKYLVPGTAYATCDGVYVEPQDPVRKGWFERSRDSETPPVFHDVTDLDPWGPCVNAARPPHVGVLVRQFEVDQDGTKTGDGYLTTVDPRDIKGTWAEFMSLHAEKIRVRGVERQRREVMNSIDEQFQFDVAGVDGADWDITWHYGRLDDGGYGHDDVVASLAVRLTFTPDQLATLAGRLGVAVPPELVHELRERYRNPGEWAALVAQRDRERDRKRKRKARV